MMISKFVNELQTSFKLFFRNEVETDTRFGGGEFSITGYLIPKDSWRIIRERVCFYDIRINFPNSFDPIPMVTYIDFPILGEDASFPSYLTLEEAVVYIKEHLATVKSKVIYDNF